MLTFASIIIGVILVGVSYMNVEMFERDIFDKLLEWVVVTMFKKSIDAGINIVGSSKIIGLDVKLLKCLNIIQLVFVVFDIIGFIGFIQSINSQNYGLVITLVYFELFEFLMGSFIEKQYMKSYMIACSVFKLMLGLYFANTMCVLSYGFKLVGLLIFDKVFVKIKNQLLKTSFDVLVSHIDFTEDGIHKSILDMIESLKNTLSHTELKTAIGTTCAQVDNIVNQISIFSVNFIEKIETFSKCVQPFKICTIIGLCWLLNLDANCGKLVVNGLIIKIFFLIFNSNPIVSLVKCSFENLKTKLAIISSSCVNIKIMMLICSIGSKVCK